MSTGCECAVLKAGGRWYYVLEHTNAPKNAWDWRENATAWGPFASSEAALEHLRRHHPNPGGHSTDESDGEPDDVLAELIANARR